MTGRARQTGTMALALTAATTLALLLGGCSGEHGAAPAKQGNAAAGSPASGAATAPAGSASAAAPATAGTTQAPAHPPLPLKPGEGQFILMTVGGKKPPVSIGKQAGCDARIIAGSLRIDSGKFIFREAVQRVCGGKPTGEATYKAQGSAKVNGPTVTLKTASGSAFHTATGSLNTVEHQITLRQLDTSAGRRTVAWAFQRR